MICYNCRNKFYIKRNFLSLFETKQYYICDACKKNYPIELSFEDIPLESFGLRIVSIWKFLYRLNLDAYSSEISRIVEKILKLHPNFFFIYFDSFRLTDFTLEIVSFLADTEGKNILLICGELKK